MAAESGDTRRIGDAGEETLEYGPHSYIGRFGLDNNSRLHRVSGVCFLSQFSTDGCRKCGERARFQHKLQRFPNAAGNARLDAIHAASNISIIAGNNATESRDSVAARP